MFVNRVIRPLVSALLAGAVLCSVGAPLAAGEATPEPPQLVSILPLGGKAGETVEAAIRGQFLDQARLVWFYCDQLEAEIVKVEPLEAEGQTGPLFGLDPASSSVSVRIRIDGEANLGVHHFRVVTPAGISNPLRFRVTSETHTLEVESPHDRARTAQPVDSFPALIQGGLPGLGEVDYYSFQASPGETFCFEIDFFTSSAVLGLWTFRPTLSLYELKGSWFDPDREARLAASDPMSYRPTLGFTPSRDGEYYLAVGEISGKPGMDDNPGYQLRLSRAQDSGQAACAFEAEQPAHQTPLRWTWGSEAAQALVPTVSERDFSRKIEGDWIEKLWSRTVKEDPDEPEDGEKDSLPAAPVTTSFDLLTENEPNDGIDRALEVTAIPAVLEGVIERPGDVDVFRLRVNSGDLLAFELETPVTKPSKFIPWIKILNSDGEEVFENLVKWWGRSGNFVVKSLEAKTLHRFEAEGEYFLKVRDVTSRHGNSEFSYRLLVRPQVPHVGAVRPNRDYVQLRPGEASTLDLVLELEEGFQGEVLLSVDNLPPGVTAFPAVATEPPRPAGADLPDLTEEKLYRPSSQKVTIALLADREASPDPRPRFIDLTGQPMVDGQLGAPFVIARIPLLVLGEEDDAADDKRAALNE